MSALPAYLDTHAAIVGASGAGKTVTAKAQVEQLLGDGRHTVIIDPTGAWWGLQTSADGEVPGFDIPIFGGAHANVPITPDDGAVTASVILDERVSAIVDLSEIHDGEGQRRFLAAFIARLRGKPPANLHLVVDEADEACPQTAPDGEGYRLLQDMIWIAKRGRVRGFVLHAITQRPADISKAVLSQVQTIITHQLVAPQDQAAIDAYLKANGDPKVRAEVMASLPGLARGERWVYAPRLNLLERGLTPPIATFDSSATPTAGEERAAPRAWREIDASAIIAAMATARPKAGAPAAPDGADAGDLAAKDAEIARLRAAVDQAKRLGGLLYHRGVVVGIGRAAATLDGLVRAENDKPNQPPVDADTVAALDAAMTDAHALKSIFPITEAVAKIDTPSRGTRPADVSAGVKLTAGTAGETAQARKMIEALAGFYPRALSIEHIARIADVSMKSSQWRRNWQSFVDSPLVKPFTIAGQWEMSTAGRDAFGLAGKPDDPAALIDFWVRSLPPSTGAMLRAVVQAKTTLTKAEIAARAGVSPTSSGLGSGLRELRDHKLIVGDGDGYRAGVLL